MSIETKKIFISYSWAIQERVIALAERLMSNGIEVIIDVWDLNVGHDKYKFMEQAVTDETVNHVLIICDKSYSEKANSRAGGVGDETVIITPEIYGQYKQEKFIPIIFQKDDNGEACTPAYLKSRMYIDLSDEQTFETEYERLLRIIYKEPLLRRPKLGKKPEWLVDEGLDYSAIRDSIKQISGIHSNSRKRESLLQRSINDFLEAFESLKLAEECVIEEGLLTAIDSSKIYRDLFVNYCEAMIYNDCFTVDCIVAFFEQLFNSVKKREFLGFNNADIELHKFLVWELYISLTVILLHYERYSDLSEILRRPYFLLSLSGKYEASRYFEFRPWLGLIEDVCKPKSANSRLITLAGNILVLREKVPLLTKQSIVNADLILYQLGQIVYNDLTGVRDCWFPNTYVYQSYEEQLIWKKLCSKSHCRKVVSLFGVENEMEIKELLGRIQPRTDIRYRNSFDRPRWITDSIIIEEIGVFA